MKMQQLGRYALAATLLTSSQFVLACTEETAPPVAVATSAAAVTTVAAVPTTAPIATHIVEKGDRMVDIAQRYDIPLGQLIAWNDVPNPDLIEVGKVIYLEDPSAVAIAATVAPTSATAPVASGTPLPRIVQQEVTEKSFNERLSEWWAGAPRPSLSGDAVQQGVFAAVALPSAVLGFLLLWWFVRLSARGVKRLRGVMGRDGDGAEADGNIPSTGDEGNAGVEALRRTGGFGGLGRVVRSIGATVAGAFGVVIRLGGRAGRATGRGLSAATLWSVARMKLAAGFVARTLHVGARRAADAHTARRERVRDEEIRRESRRWWSQGRERLRIGLLDEAEECFETGLKLSVEGGWHEEISLYREELKLLAERRAVERGLVPSISER